MRASPTSSGGIIPARAGFTRASGGPRRRCRDHPRSRGVYGPVVPLARDGRGSSPLARGLQPPRERGSLQFGIIPARAGFTLPRPSNLTARLDHPRSRGVYCGKSASSVLCGGSSPLARGLRSGPGPGSLAIRIIPARAGFTGARSRWAPPDRDHSRSRGVYTRPRPMRRPMIGSSPLARGLHFHEDSGVLMIGIIPARAGFTRPTACRRRPAWDHPRSRGVYRTAGHPVAVIPGSSPLARGLRRQGRLAL